jgi:ATP-binding protein involved in chromosome partitioning
VLDADIYGPSQPSMFGLKNQKPDIHEGKFAPVVREGMQTMSIGYLIGEEVPMIWRGPMIGKALQQIIADTAWDAIDYLIVDLPPGTGDIQLTLCQKIPVTGALMVTTPQELALLDVRRACEMLKKLNVPILGVVENMSRHSCRSCGHQEAIFGEGGGAKIAATLDAALLACIPLDSHIRETTDTGGFFSNAATFKEAALFSELALKITGKISCMPKDYSAKFPTIKIEG